MGRLTTRLIIYRKTGDDIQVYSMYNLSGELTDTDHYLVIAKVTARLAVHKQAAQKFDVEQFNLRRLSEWRLGNSIRLRSQTGLQLWKT